MNASFMKPLKTEAKEYCRKGHELERPFLEQLFEHSRAGLTARYDIKGVHASPLVASTSSTTRGVLDSADVKVLCVDNTISTSDSDSDSEDDGSDKDLGGNGRTKKLGGNGKKKVGGKGKKIVGGNGSMKSGNLSI